MVASELATYGVDSTTDAEGAANAGATRTPVILGLSETIDGQSCPDTASIRSLLQSLDTHLSQISPRVDPYLLSVQWVLESADHSATVIRGLIAHSAGRCRFVRRPVQVRRSI